VAAAIPATGALSVRCGVSSPRAAPAPGDGADVLAMLAAPVAVRLLRPMIHAAVDTEHLRVA
jgi:hypothetical protein